MAKTKVFTLRLSDDDARRAELTARVDGVSVNEMFRQALQHYLDLKREDPEFCARAREMVARDAEFVGQLR
jgi:predicted transcriptional regulator